MAALKEHYVDTLQKKLEAEYVPHLPKLVPNKKSDEENRVKNISRAFAAYSLALACGLPPVEAAAQVTDDYDDHGIDAICYRDGTLYLVQSKFQKGKSFGGDEASSYCAGVRSLLSQDNQLFNKHVKDRWIEIEDAVEECNVIKLVIGHIGEEISLHANTVLNQLFDEQEASDERLDRDLKVISGQNLIESLLESTKYPSIDADLYLDKHQVIAEPRKAYFGLIRLKELVDLHVQHGKGLYVKNIRNFLGRKTDVNEAIIRSIGENSSEFVFMNNGVTALCSRIEPKTANSGGKGKKRLKVSGLSVINGAQTIASAAKYVEENPSSDISNALVTLTVIQATSDHEFGKKVTKARNHQNQITLANFVALDDRQERIRQDLALKGFHYSYRAGEAPVNPEINTFSVVKAAHGLVLFLDNPSVVTIAKKESGRFLDANSEHYDAIFPAELSPIRIINAVEFLKYIENRIASEAKSLPGNQRLLVKHGLYALGWILAKRLKSALDSNGIWHADKLGSQLSAPFDELREVFVTTAEQGEYLNNRGALSLSRNLAAMNSLLAEVMVNYYGLASDPVLAHKPTAEQKISYLNGKAPQITGLA
jgi:hypothetical protein